MRNQSALITDVITLQSLQDKRVLSIDLSAIMAGSGIRGQFEEKFKALIRDIEDEVCTHYLLEYIVH
jgi:ATP-dependent Clp protease ATP-binding subunit ClpA